MLIKYNFIAIYSKEYFKINKGLIIISLYKINL